MEFSSYVPACVRQYLQSALDGDCPAWPNLASGIQNAEVLLAAIDGHLNGSIPLTSTQKEIYRQQKSALSDHISNMRARLNLPQQLAVDPRMREAYSRLGALALGDENWKAFFEAVLLASRDFSQTKGALKKAEQHRRKITEAAAQLVVLLNSIAMLEIYGVRIRNELFHVPNTFELRGDLIKDMGDHFEIDRLPPATYIRVIAQLLRSSEHWKPIATDTIVQHATASNKNIAKSNFLRAMWRSLDILQDGPRQSPNLTHAVAVVATVALSNILSNADIDVSYDDARKVLEHSGRN